MSGVRVLPDEVQAFLSEELVATLALPINAAGDIHAASLVFWLDPETNYFYFVTGRNSEKCQLLLDGHAVQAACLVGTRKGTPHYLQTRGRVTTVEPQNHKTELDAYYRKRGNRNDDITATGNVLLCFIPDWIRWTDYRQGVVVRQLVEQT
ncbi:MAG TPA: pyridoxamine 5'-phosphate oxidase family protein [Candidatus Saccharimonadales bacterium]|nr:pyridoxamine 5'-phosphate oxidase family protein [Candidatus Saccharimonadales bacterium]